MKQLLKSLFLAAILTVLAITLYSCDVPSYVSKDSYRQLQEREREYRRKENIRRTYREPMEKAALRMTKHISNIISPQSGKNWRPSVDIENMEYYKKDNMVAAYVILRWDARHFPAGIGYGTCEVDGILYLYLPYRTIDSKKAFFEYDRVNDHVTKVSNSSHWEQISRGLIITME